MAPMRVATLLLAGLAAAPRPLAAPPGAQTLFREVDGVVSIEAEHAGTVKRWVEEEGESGKAMRDDASRHGGEMTYEILFSKGGTYYVFFLCRDQGNTETNDCFLTLDKERLIGPDGRTRPDGMRSQGAKMTWVSTPKGPGGHTPEAVKKGPVHFDVPGPGLRILKVESRSKGFVVDKIVLKRNDDAPPKGGGPPETAVQAR